MTVRRIISSEGQKAITAIHNLHNKSLKVGWFKDSKYEDGIQVALVAAQNEFGNPSKNIPARPFLRPTVIREENNWIKISNDGAKKILKGQLTIDQVLDLLGFKAEADVKKSIELVYNPPLARATIQARLSKYKNKTKVGNLTKPLVDTAHMLNTVTHELSDE